jgi:hypothetical protein
VLVRRINEITLGRDQNPAEEERAVQEIGGQAFRENVEDKVIFGLKNKKKSKVVQSSWPQ